jgi:hypothetical protein
MSTAAVPVLDHAQHAYTLNGKALVSVTNVIGALLKKSIDGVDAEVLRNAAERGTLVEQYSTELFANGSVQVPAGERNDVLDRLVSVERWWTRKQPKLIAAQQIVCDEENGVAGMLDFLLEIDGVEWLVDMKCTAAPDPSWALQVGAYAHMMNHVGPTAIFHVNPKYADGYIWRVHKTMAVRRQWESAIAWYRTVQELKLDVKDNAV